MVSSTGWRGRGIGLKYFLPLIPDCTRKLHDLLTVPEHLGEQIYRWEAREGLEVVVAVKDEGVNVEASEDPDHVAVLNGGGV